jgi:hypothetical protein
MTANQTMTAVDWGFWAGYVVIFAIIVFAKTIFWFRHTVRDVKAALTSWEGLLLLAFFVAIGISQQRQTGLLQPLVAFGLASAMIVGAAVNAAYGLGLKNGRRTGNP